ANNIGPNKAAAVGIPENSQSKADPKKPFGEHLVVGLSRVAVAIFECRDFYVVILLIVQEKGYEYHGRQNTLYA
ncbi:MAG: hypothetical protein OEY80_10985, partial [Nitrospirota bacterium]|nr:hypothetical protein [Nitrospirota bacterium]